MIVPSSKTTADSKPSSKTVANPILRWITKISPRGQEIIQLTTNSLWFTVFSDIILNFRFPIFIQIYSGKKVYQPKTTTDSTNCSIRRQYKQNKKRKTEKKQQPQNINLNRLPFVPFMHCESKNTYQDSRL